MRLKGVVCSALVLSSVNINCMLIEGFGRLQRQLVLACAAGNRNLFLWLFEKIMPNWAELWLLQFSNDNEGF